MLAWDFCARDAERLLPCREQAELVQHVTRVENALDEARTAAEAAAHERAALALECENLRTAVGPYDLSASADGSRLVDATHMQAPALHGYKQAAEAAAVMSCSGAGAEAGAADGRG